MIALTSRRTKADVLAAVEATLAEHPPVEVTTERLVEHVREGRR